MSESLKQTIGKLTIKQLLKLSDEVEKISKQEHKEKLNIKWQRLIRQEKQRKQSEKNQRKVKRTGVILIKRRKTNEQNKQVA